MSWATAMNPALMERKPLGIAHPQCLRPAGSGCRRLSILADYSGLDKRKKQSHQGQQPPQAKAIGLVTDFQLAMGQNE